MIDRFTNDPQIVDAVAAYSRESGTPIQVGIARATRYAYQIVPAFNAYAYFRTGKPPAKSPDSQFALTEPF